jgi:hypothetical protein
LASHPLKSNSLKVSDGDQSAPQTARRTCITRYKGNSGPSKVPGCAGWLAAWIEQANRLKNWRTIQALATPILGKKIFMVTKKPVKTASLPQRSYG